jgi:hypothetical protein
MRGHPEVGEGARGATRPKKGVGSGPRPNTSRGVDKHLEAQLSQLAQFAFLRHALVGLLHILLLGRASLTCPAFQNGAIQQISNLPTPEATGLHL